MTAAVRRWLVVMLAALLPLLLLGAVLYLILARGTGIEITAPAPLERVDFERTIFRDGQIIVHVRNSGPQPVTVAQVTVNEALWSFSLQPNQSISRLGRATLSIPYPWIAGDPYEITVITSNGLKFAHAVAIAAETPSPGLTALGTYALLGVYVGVIPVYLGLLWFPVVRGLGKSWFGFLLALTAGLLIFLGIDALEEGLEAAEGVPSPFQGMIVLAGGAVLSFLTLEAAARRATANAVQRGEYYVRRMLAFMIALGIGLHNLGEGLAIGAAFALGEAALGTLLIVGFTIHNTTEGLGIIAPISQDPPRLGSLALLGLLAGGPTILGAWVGGFTYSAPLAVLFLGVGAGAIFQVVYALLKFMGKSPVAVLSQPLNLAGLSLGLVLMYVTALAVAK